MTEDTETDETSGEQTPAAGEHTGVGAGRAESASDGGTASEGAAETTGTASSDGSPESTGPTAGERLAWLVQVGALVILCLVALVATFRFYFAASTAIGVWIADDYVSVFQAAFNLLILVACAFGVSVLVRRLR